MVTITFTYDGDPNTNRERVRLLIGDTDSTDQQFNDAEIDWFLAENGTSNIYRAGQAAAEALVAKYARQMYVQIGDMQLHAEQKFGHYTRLAETLAARECMLNPPVNVYAGGIRESDMESWDEDTDRPSPSFVRGMTDNPGSGTDLRSDFSGMGAAS